MQKESGATHTNTSGGIKKPVDENSIFVRFLLPTGDSKVFELDCNATVEQSKKRVLEDWPKG